ncbi:cerato-platanin [Purpureocillium lavendulum]|uniref:Cerato-platanin n=1 Tax=Purpureocillium lavendulum TaxID=1247861 RepID=A0AB34FH26_9HYPO|nr:cerato-platanin [Purpureocillium lavendulum]
MGRRKVEIRKLPSQRDRNATYKKRKPGLVKKARELAVLTDSCVHLSILNRDKWEEHRFSVDDLPAAPAASGGDGSAARAPPPTPFQIQEETNGCEGTGALALLSWAPEEPIAPTEDWQAPGASQGMDGTLASLSSWCNGDVGLAPLVTAGSYVAGYASSDLALGKLDRLQAISWAGLRTKRDIAALGAALRRNAKHLRGLTLDFIGWDLVMNHWNTAGDRASYMSRHVFQIEPTSASLQYPALNALSLSGLDITPYAQGLACAMRSPSLRSITLRRCPGWDAFLCFFVEPGSEPTLLNLEIYQPVHFYDPDDADVVVREFLNSARGLQNIYVSIPGPCDTKSLWRMIAARHSSTLRRLAYHVREINLDDESKHFEKEMDMNDLGLISESFWNRLLGGDTEFDGDESDDSGSDELRLNHDSWFDEQSPNPLGNLQLECIGLACRPFRLVRLPPDPRLSQQLTTGQIEVLEPFTKKNCLRMLHIRQSGSDIRCFGSWAFGRKSPPRLPLVEHPPTESRRDVLFLGDKEPGWVSTVPGQTGLVPVETVLNGGFCHFADWVFGKDGISSLEMVVYGDFSCQGRLGQDCFMLRRGGTIGGQAYPYSFYFPESQDDPDLEKLLSQNPGFLEACPTETLLVSRQ